MIIDPLHPRAEKLVLVLEAIGDDKICKREITAEGAIAHGLPL
jgi:hypothetical protein